MFRQLLPNLWPILVSFSDGGASYITAGSALVPRHRIMSRFRTSPHDQSQHQLPADRRGLPTFPGVTLLRVGAGVQPCSATRCATRSIRSHPVGGARMLRFIIKRLLLGTSVLFAVSIVTS